MDTKEFEKNLLTKLSKADVDKTFFKNATKTILNLTDRGFDFDRTYWKGWPKPNVLIISGKFGEGLNSKDIVEGIKLNMDTFPIGLLPDAVQIGVRIKMKAAF